MSTLERLLFGQNPPTDEFGKDMEKELDRFGRKLQTILNKGVKFDDNLDAEKFTTITEAKNKILS